MKSFRIPKEFKIHRRHIVILATVGFVFGWLGILLFQSPLRTIKEVSIEEGQGVNAIAETLEQEGVIESKLAFVVYTLVTGSEKKLQAGRYVFKPGATIPGIVYAVTKGYAESDDFVVTIPEGFNVFDINRRLAGIGLVKEGEFAKKYYLDEGQFFPDTYRFNHETCSVKRETCVDEIAQKMKNHLNLKFKDTSLVLNTLVFHDILIRASILEKEARKEEDMRLVAGVIENRLKRKMPLQIDAAVAYGACLREFKKFKSLNVSRFKYCDVSQVAVGQEIKIDGPYNTYIRAGLPSGAIANPGITAIQAALDPIKSDYLYYLSTRDGSRIIFSKTAAEHAANRRKYLGI